MKYSKIILISILLVPSLVLAHGPSRQKVVQEIEINATAESIWKIIEDFCSIQDWHPGIKSCNTDNGTAIKSIRTIELANGEKINEILFKHDKESKKIQYGMQELDEGRIIKGLPIATHGSTITITEDGGMSKVKWKGAFYRSFPGQQPPPELTDEACSKAVNNLYKTGLESLKKIAEK